MLRTAISNHTGTDAESFVFHRQDGGVRGRISWWSWSVFLAVGATGTVLRFVFLDRQGLWFDEGVGLIFSNCTSIRGCLDIMLDTRTSERFQFMYPLLLHEWRLLFGSNEFALRSLSVICNLGAMAFVWLTALRSFGATHAAWSLTFMAVSAFAIVHAQEARPYTFFLLIAATQIYLFLQARDRKRGAKATFHLVTAFASWVGLFPLLFSVALAVADLVNRRFRLNDFKEWLVWWLPSGLLCLPAAGYYIFAAATILPSHVTVPKSDTPFLNLAFVIYGQLVGETFGPPVQDLRGPGRIAALWDGAPWLALLTAISVLSAVQIVRLYRREWSIMDRTDTRVLVCALISYLTLSFLFAVFTRHNWLPRHAVSLHPLLALLLPLLGCAPAIARWLPSGRLLIAGFLLLNLISVGHHYFDRAHWKDDYRGVAAYLGQVGEPQRPVLVLRGLPVLLDYYGYNRLIAAPDLPRDKVPEVVEQAAAGRPEIVIVVNREIDLWPVGWLESALAAEFKLIATRRMPYFSVYTYARR